MSFFNVHHISHVFHTFLDSIGVVCSHSEISVIFLCFTTHFFFLTRASVALILFWLLVLKSIFSILVQYLPSFFYTRRKRDLTTHTEKTHGNKQKIAMGKKEDILFSIKKSFFPLEIRNFKEPKKPARIFCYLHFFYTERTFPRKQRKTQ